MYVDVVPSITRLCCGDVLTYIRVCGAVAVVRSHALFQYRASLEERP